MNRVDVADGGLKVSTEMLVSWSEMAEMFVRADSRWQAGFFEHLAIALSSDRIGGGRWAMQCRAIAEHPGWLPLNRTRIAGLLETLAEHMREDGGNAALDSTGEDQR